MNSLNFLILHLLIFVMPTCFSSSSNTQWYDDCGENFYCGNVTTGFPFWGGSSRPKECGYPKLQLHCEDDIKVTIQIATMKFYVLDIHLKNKVLPIAREDLSDGLFLQQFENTTLDYNQFYYALGTQNITLLYGCPSHDEDSYGGEGIFPGQFTCRIDGVNGTLGYYQSRATGPNGCHASVVVPVLASQELQIDIPMSLSQVVDNGFEVNYKAQDQDVCSKCVASKGHCGFDAGTNNATCVCPDGSFGYAPYNNNNNNKALFPRRFGVG